MRGKLAVVLLWGGLTVSVSAAAEPDRAQRLFEEGKSLLVRGETAAACDKFDASNEVDSTLGSLLRAADCREKNGQLATAWRGFSIVIERAERERARAYLAEAKRRAAALKPRLSHLELAFQALPKGAVVTLDGERLAASEYTDSLLDPGAHELVISADNHEPYRVDVTAVEGKHVQLLIPELKPQPATSLQVDEPSTPESDGLTGTQLGALVVGGVGAAVMVTGAVFGGLALSQWSDVQNRCPSSPCSEPSAATLHEEPLRNANVSTGLLAAGGTMVGAGVVMWLLGGPGSSEEETQSRLRWTPVVADGELGIMLRGEF